MKRIGGRNTRLTETDERDQLSAKFFDEVMLPLAERVRARRTSFFPLGYEPELETYFVTPQRKVMTPDDFELPAAESSENFTSELAALWAREGHEELAAIGPQLAVLARKLAEQEPAEDEDVSPFM